MVNALFPLFQQGLARLLMSSDGCPWPVLDFLRSSVVKVL